MFIDFKIESIIGVQFKLHGLGPLNWVLKMMVVDRLKKVTRNLLMVKIREEIRKVVAMESIVDQLYIHVLQRRISRN